MWTRACAALFCFLINSCSTSPNSAASRAYTDGVSGEGDAARANRSDRDSRDALAAGADLATNPVITRSEPAQPTAGPETPSALNDACAGVDETAHSVSSPADIIVAVDSTSSMTEETKFVQAQLNAFTRRIVDAKVDVRLILICQKPGPFVGNPICIPPPLAGASCSDNEPGFMHIDQLIGNHDAWEQIVAMYPRYQHLLRPGAQKHIVVITDDSPGIPRATFDQMLKSTDVQFQDYKHHAIYASKELGGPACGEGDGADYGRLSDETMGVKGNLCLQGFEKLWDELATNIQKSAPLSCDWEIPAVPAGQTLDPQLVNVHYSGEGVRPQLIGWVQSDMDCAAGDGWFYDDNTNPRRVLVCPQTCATLRALDRARIDIKFGCKRCVGLDLDCGGVPPPKPPELL